MSDRLLVFGVTCLVASASAFAAHAAPPGKAAPTTIYEVKEQYVDAGGVLISTQTVSLAAGGEKSLTALWSISEGIHDVYVVVDRMNTIIESDESNNRTSVRVMTDMVDITLSATDLVFSPGHPVSGDAAALTITAHNTGIKGTGAFNLALYNNDPNGGGTLLQTFPIENLAGDGSTTVTYALNL